LPASVAGEDPYFFPLTDGAIAYAAQQNVTRDGDALIVETQAGSQEPASVEGVLRLRDGYGLSVIARPGSVTAGARRGLTRPLRNPGSIDGRDLGGLLLNVMPCVFPILSLKALSLAKAGGDEAGARKEAVAYTAGAVAICVALGAAVLALRAGGNAAGWAFQLQDPRVILLLLLLVTAIALNLAGLFELPSIGSAVTSLPAAARWAPSGRERSPPSWRHPAPAPSWQRPWGRPSPPTARGPCRFRGPWPWPCFAFPRPWVRACGATTLAQARGMDEPAPAHPFSAHVPDRAWPCLGVGAAVRRGWNDHRPCRGPAPWPDALVDGPTPG
jgi:hypothetical protein